VHITLIVDRYDTSASRPFDIYTSHSFFESFFGNPANMQFTTFALTALSIGGALAQTVHIVSVGSSNGTTQYFPNNVVADIGDAVQFQYRAGNHTITQSTFDQPCQPIANNSPNVTGFFSGFMAVAKGDSTVPTYTIMITNKTPIWVYCSQAKHCQAGMNLVINENTAANASRSLEAYTAAAALATANLAPGGSASVSNGTSGATNGGSSSGSGSGSGSGTTSAGPSTQSVSGAPAIRWSSSLAMGGVLAVVMALFV